jgi:hypothetical protein
MDQDLSISGGNNIHDVWIIVVQVRPQIFKIYNYWYVVTSYYTHLSFNIVC